MLQVHLHAGHFTLQDKETQHSYGGPLQGLLDHLGTRSLPAALAQSLLLSGRASGSSEGTSSNAGTGGSLANANLYDNGALRVTVTDHRLSPAAVYVVSLGPSPASLHADLKGLLGLSAGGRYSTATTDSLDDASGKMLQLEAELYPLLEPGLDLEPDIAVTQRANTARYNALKYQQTPRRGRRALAAQESSAITMSGNANSGGKRKRGAARVELDDEVERQTAKELNEWMTLLSPKKEFFPRFQLLSFMQDWKRRKSQADAESLVPAITNESQKKKGYSKKPLAPFLHGKRCVRSLKFEHEIDKVKTYTLLNIYEVSFNEYEAVLRWGTVDGTSLNGSSLRYPIGNKVAVEYYVGHFKGFYGITSKLVADQVMTTGTAGTGGGKGQPVQRQGSMSSSAGGGHSLDSEDRMSVVTSSSYGGNEDHDSSVHPPTIERRPSSVKLKVKPLRK